MKMMSTMTGRDVLEVEAELGGEASASALVCFFQEVS